MNFEEITLNQLFEGKVTGGNKPGHFDSSEKIQGVQKKISQKNQEVGSSFFTGKILEKTSELLNIKLKDVLVNGWKKYQQVEQCLEQGKENPDEMFKVPILDHTITSEHHPQLDIIFAGESQAKLDCKLLFKLNLHGIMLKIKGEKIVGVAAGSCQCHAALDCEGIPLFEDSSETYDF